jgi:hypothetical protein
LINFWHSQQHSRSQLHVVILTDAGYWPESLGSHRTVKASLQTSHQFTTAITSCLTPVALSCHHQFEQFAISGQWLDLLLASQPTVAVWESVKTDCFYF